MDARTFAELLADDEMLAVVVEGLETYRSLVRRTRTSLFPPPESEYFSQVITSIGRALAHARSGVIHRMQPASIPEPSPPGCVRSGVEQKPVGKCHTGLHLIAPRERLE